MKESSKYNFSKGFTMIELLTTVVILGILSVIAINSIQRILDKSESEYYSNQEENMILAAQTYYQNNRKELPKSIGQERKVTLKKLQDTKYIDAVNDRHKKVCNSTDSYVEVLKYTQKDYKYKVYLDCGDEYKTKITDNSILPEITIETPSADKYDEIKDVKAIIKMKGAAEDTSIKLSSYNYVILQAQPEEGVALEDLSYKEVKNSGSIAVKSKTRQKEIILDEYLPAVIKIQATAINETGEKTTYTTPPLNFADLNAPLCPNRNSPDYANLVFGENTDWTNQTYPKEITIICKDQENGSECARPYYTELITEEGEQAAIYLEDKAGNKSKCMVNVYTDLTPPTLVINVKDKSGNIIKTISTTKDNPNQTLNTGWLGSAYADGISIEYSVKDTAGLKTISINRNAYNLTPTSSNLNEFGEPNEIELNGEKTADGIVEELVGESYSGYNIYTITLTDISGKTSNVNLTVPYDVTKPTITFVNSSKNKWTNKNVKITITPTDTLSGLSKVDYSYDKTNWYTDWDDGSTLSNTVGTWSAERDNTVYLRVTDAAGNQKIEETSVKIDKTCPVVVREKSKEKYSSSKNVNGDGRFYLRLVFSGGDSGSYQSGAKTVEYDHCYTSHAPDCDNGWTISSAYTKDPDDYPKDYDNKSHNYHYSYKSATLYGYWRVIDNAGNKCYYNYKIVWNSGTPSTFSLVKSAKE